MAFEGELGNPEKSKQRVGVGNTGCPHCIFCVRGVVAVRVDTELALHGRTLFGQPFVLRKMAGEGFTG